MVWFIVDDKFHSSEEVMSIPLGQRAAAIGLWALAGAWSSDQLKNGYVPGTHLENWGGSPELATCLVRAKLWTKVGTRGYQFRNWEKWQKTREQVETSRERERDRKAEWRRRKAEESGERPPDVPRDTSGRPGTPSHPIPNPLTEQEISVGPVQETADRRVSTSGDKPVHDWPSQLGRVKDLARKECGRELDDLGAAAVIEYIWKRRGDKADPVRNAPRYFTTTIRSAPIEFQQFIDEKGIAS